jgi:PAS domain S-box-containing protein
MQDLEQLAFDQAPMGLALTEQRVIRSCNQTFADMFGYTKAQLIGQSFRLLYGTDQEFHQVRDIGLGP